MVKNMSALVFPNNWVPYQSTNKHATHSFKVNEKELVNEILITISNIKPEQVSFHINATYESLITQIYDESKNMSNYQMDEISGKSGRGFYFVATDKRWNGNQDDWPCMLRCFYVTETNVIEITVLCFSLNSDTIKQALDFIRSI